MWTAGHNASRVLSSWWHLPAYRYGQSHDYEQHVLQWSLSHLHDAAPLMGVLQLHAMSRVRNPELPLTHVDHTQRERRLYVMCLELITASLESESALFPVGPAAAPPLHQRARLHGLLRRARAVPRPLGQPPMELRRAVRRAAAELLTAGFASPRGLSQASGSARCVGNASNTRLRTVPFNATKVARTVLGRNGLLATGLPLVLLPCGQAPTAALQGWRPTPGGAGGWSLAAHPTLCLVIGPRKAPKKPYPLLAQLDTCRNLLPATAALDLNASTMRSRHRIGQLRAPLAAAAAAWRGRRPAASRAPLEAMRRLGSRPPAGRARKAPLWQDGSVAVGADADRMCLGVWRGRGGFRIGASLVFTSCADQTGTVGTVQLRGADSREAAHQLVLLPTGHARPHQAGMCVSAAVPGVTWPLQSP